MLPDDQLAAMQVPGQDEVIAGMSRCLPDSRVMCAQDANMRVDRRGGFRAGDRDHPVSMQHARHAVMNPSPAAMFNRLTNAVHADPLVVVATNSEYRCDVVELVDQVAQSAQLRASVHQIAPQQHDIRIAASHDIQHLPAQRIGATAPEMNVADVQQATRLGPRGESLFADMQGSMQPDLQRPRRSW